MAKVNPWSLRKIERPATRKVFREPLQPDFEVAITLRAQTVPEASMAARRGEEYAAMCSGTDAAGHPRFFLTPDGERITLSEETCQSLAVLEAMQAPEDEADRYGMGDLVGLMMRAPSVFNAISLWAAELQQEVGLGKLAGVELKPSSEAPSLSTSPTPSPPSTPATPSGPSTNGSEKSSDCSEPSEKFAHGGSHRRTKAPETAPRPLLPNP